MIVAYFSDKQKHRCGYIVVCVVVCLVGLCLTAFAKQNPVRYFGKFTLAKVFRNSYNFLQALS